MDSRITIEACVESLEEAIYAERHGAHRLELCANLHLEGTTPQAELIRSILNQVSIPVKVMIRPRGGDFVYSNTEFNLMLADIIMCTDLGVSEIVTGILKSDNTLDLERIAALSETAAPMGVTINKCIDIVPDIYAALLQLQQIPGVHSVLSSGQADTAMQGAWRLKEMLHICGARLTLIVAGGVKAANLDDLVGVIGAQAYHGRRIV